MRNRILIVVAGLVLIASIGVILADPFGWRGTGPTALNTSPPTAVPSVTSSVRAPVGQAQEVAAALSKLADDPAAIASSDLRKQVAGNPAAAVPPGSKIDADPASWAPDGLGGGIMTVTITPPGQPAQAYSALMVKEPGGWKVALTLPISESPPAGASR